VPEAISRRIVVTAYDGISLLDIAGPLEAFRVASTFGGPSPSGRLGTYECSVVSVRGGLVKTANGIESVAEDSGFSNEEQMRCSFIRILGIPPREYRKRFATTV
jgi:transcriptional regulator GlxA family with amidase domain